MKRRYKADPGAWERAVNFYSATASQTIDKEILEFLTERVHEVRTDGQIYMQAENEYEDSELRSLCSCKYGYRD